MKFLNKELKIIPEQSITPEEDENLDGKPDLWEVYDDAEAVVLRKRGLDYDGVPDTIENEREKNTPE